MTRILVDTSVWIDHLHATEATLVRMLDDGVVAMHPMIVGELALGSIRNRRAVLDLLGGLPMIAEADHVEVLSLVDARGLFGCGLGLVDAHLLASALIAGDVRVWTRDKRLGDAAAALGVRAAG